MSPTQKKKAAAKTSKTKAKPVKSAVRKSPRPGAAAKGAQSQAALGGATAAADPPINVLVWLRAKKGKEAPLERALRTLVGPSRAETGCQDFALHRSADLSGDFFLHEIWSSGADLANHWQTPHFQHWKELQSAILESRRRFLAE